MAAGGRGTGETVEIRAFRGGRRTSVYHEHALSGEVFRRIVDTAGAAGLPVLAELEGAGPHELDKRHARLLAAEVGRLRIGGELLELDADLTAIAEVASWCARAPGASRLTVAAS
jgi:hypothetical protein